MYENSRRPINFIEGSLERLSQGQRWISYWCVLTDDTIFLYNSEFDSEVSLEDGISLGPESRLDVLGGDEMLGYKFRVRTKESQNTFKVYKRTDREYWRACVEGITLGRFDEKIDLLPGQKEDIRIKLHDFFLTRKQTTSASTNDFHTSSSSSDNDGIDYLLPHPPKNKKPAPPQKYKFYPNTSRMDTPSWFLSECSRELAEKILKTGAAYGNTLMRKSTNGSKNLVISKRMETSIDQNFTHYIITSTSQGYKIDVENQHEPMQSLSDVMDFFIATSGKLTTKPMKTNDLQLLGIHLQDPVYNDYNKTIVSTAHDPDSGEEIDAEVNVDSLLLPKQEFAEPPRPLGNSNNVQKNNTANSRWSKRSISVPNINSPDNKGTQARVIAEVPPPLPPNHPPPKKSPSQLEIKFTDDNQQNKKKGPQHTQSMNAADIQGKISPRDQHLATKARHELANVHARINKKKEELEATSEYIEPEKQPGHIESIKSPTVATESFKKKLEVLFANPATPGVRPFNLNMSTSPSDDYENIAHYQNVHEIQNVRSNSHY